MRAFAASPRDLTKKIAAVFFVALAGIAGCDDSEDGPIMVEGVDAHVSEDATLIPDMGALADGGADAGIFDMDLAADMGALDAALDAEIPDWEMADAELPDMDLTPDMEVYGPLASACRVPSRYARLDEGGPLRPKLQDLAELAQRELSYSAARYFLFGELDNIEGQVRGVYTGQWVDVPPGEIPDIEIMNTEHTWPQSRGAGELPARSDLHHLYPAIAEANSRRLNYSMGEVVHVDWSMGGSAQGDDATGRSVFEPRDDHKGAAARAMLYFAVRYDFQIEAEDEAVLRRWHADHPVSEREAERHDLIWVRQGNRNPFIDCPDLVEMIGDF